MRIFIHAGANSFYGAINLLFEFLLHMDFIINAKNLLFKSFLRRITCASENEFEIIGLKKNFNLTLNLIDNPKGGLAIKIKILNALLFILFNIQDASIIIFPKNFDVFITNFYEKYLRYINVALYFTHLMRQAVYCIFC